MVIEENVALKHDFIEFRLAALNRRENLNELPITDNEKIADEVISSRLD